MIREKAKELLTKLKQGTGSATIFGSSYYDDETQQIIEIITNECKSTVVKEDGTSKRYESDIYIHNVKEIIQQLLTDKNSIKNSLVSRLTCNATRNIPGIMNPISVNKKINEKGIPYIEVEKPLPDNFHEIVSGQINREQLESEVIKPYLARVCKSEKPLSRKYFISRMFSPLNRKEVTDLELITRLERYLRDNTDVSEEKVKNMARYFVINILGNNNILQELIEGETQGKSLEMPGKKQRGYGAMLQNMSNNLFDILNLLPNPNDALKEVEDIYANMVGQLEALSVEPEKNPEKIEQQIKKINRYINRHKKEYYGNNDYKIVDVGLDGKDVGFTRAERVSQAMELYSQKISELLGRAEEMGEEEYIREVTKLHFRFIQIHPFPEGNGRTARGISNMLLLEKGLVAVFDKENKPEYSKNMKGFHGIVDSEYIEALYTDHSICDRLENERESDWYKLEEYIGIKCLDNADLYKDREITEELPKLTVEILGEGSR